MKERNSLKDKDGLLNRPNAESGLREPVDEELLQIFKKSLLDSIKSNSADNMNFFGSKFDEKLLQNPHVLMKIIKDRILSGQIKQEVVGPRDALDEVKRKEKFNKKLISILLHNGGNAENSLNNLEENKYENMNHDRNEESRRREPEVQKHPKDKGYDPDNDPLNFKAANGIHFRNLTQNYKSEHMCIRYMYPTGPSMLCVPSVLEDATLVNSLRAGSYEEELMTQFVHLLYTDDSINLIDIGAGIGVFSLTAAFLNRKVLAVEPFHINFQLMHRSAIQTRMTSRITLVIDAVEHMPYSGYVEYSPHNGGVDKADIRHLPDQPEDKAYFKANVITMNNLTHVVPFNRALLLLEVSTLDATHILSAAGDFFKEMDIPYVLMHWPETPTERLNIRSKMEVFGYESRYSWDPNDKMEANDSSFIIWYKQQTNSL